MFHLQHVLPMLYTVIFDQKPGNTNSAACAVSPREITLSNTKPL